MGCCGLSVDDVKIIAEGCVALADHLGPDDLVPVTNRLDIIEAEMPDDYVDSAELSAAGVLNLTMADGTVVSADLIGLVDPVAIANAMAANAVAMQTLAGALISGDADNTIILGSDGLLFENDAV